MKRPIYILFTLLLITTSSLGQMRWTRVDTGFGDLPASITLYKTTDSLHGRPFIAYYLSVNLKDRNLRLATQTGQGKRYTPYQYYVMENKPYVVINSTFFSFEDNRNLSLVMQKGEMLAYQAPALKSRFSDSFYYPTRGAIGFTRAKKADVAWVFTDTAQRWPYAFQKRPILAKGATSDPAFTDLQTLDYWKWWQQYTAVGGGPVLVQDGAPYVTNVEEQMFVNGRNDRHPRTAIGYTGRRKLIILVIQGRFPGVAEGATLDETAQILADLGCEEALNLDGGGSSCMLVNGKETITPSDKEGQRAVPAVFMIQARKK